MAHLPSPMQREHNESRATKSCQILNISDVTRIRLHRRIQKIYEMSTDVVEGYRTFYFNKHGKLLPQETVDKIMHLYHNQIEHRCKEAYLTAEEEEQWDPEDSEEHNSDDVNFYLDKTMRMMTTTMRTILQERAATLMTQTFIWTI